MALIYCVSFALGMFGLVYGGIYSAFFDLTAFASLDLPILSAIILIGLLIFQRKYRLGQDAIFLLILLMLFFVSYFASLLYSPSYEYGRFKAVACLGLLLSFLIGLVAPTAARDFFFKMLPYLGLCTGLSYFYVLSSSYNDVSLLSFVGVSLSAGEIIGLGMVSLLNSNRHTSWTYFILACSVLLLLALGARGPLIFAILAGLTLLGVKLFENFGRVFFIRIQSLLSLGVVMVLLVMFLSAFIESDQYILLEKGLSRFYLLFEPDQGRSINIRKEMLLEAWAGISSSPIFGYGLGSYGLITTGIDQRGYPHNAILEIWFEAGIIAGLIFLIFVVSALKCSVARRDWLIFFALVFLIFNFLKSSSVDELRTFFLICGLSAGRKRTHKEES